VAVLVVVAGVAALTMRDETAQGGSLRTVFLGDSITAESAQQSWANHAVADPRSPWALEANAGVSGDTLEQMWGRFQTDVLDREPDAVVIMGGTNDVLRGLPTEGSLAALRQMVEAAQDAGIEVWLVAPPPLDQGYASLLTSLVEAERALAAELEVPFAEPTDALSGPVDGWAPGLSSDGVHPTADGARTLADAVLDDLDG